MKKKQCIEEIYKRHVDMVYRICFTYMKNIADTEDAVQTVFVKLMKSRKRFQNEEHEKAWLIVTATNTCKDLLKHWWRKNEDIQLFANTLSEGQKEPDFTEELVLSLPDRYKTVLYLYYYESKKLYKKKFQKGSIGVGNDYTYTYSGVYISTVKHIFEE